MNQALEYLESHLETEINLNDVAREAFSSAFHFQRMFSMLTGFTVGEYVRQRRLTLAAQELVSSRVKVIDIALKYGYDTPESFARAFRNLHGVSPSAARQPGKVLKGYTRLSFQIILKGEAAMDYRIVDQPGFKVIGKGIRVSTKNGENKQRIPQFWRECYENGFSAELEQLAEPKALTGQTKLGICMEFSAETQEIFYLVGVENTRGMIPEGMVEKEIPAATWAIFESTGAMPEAMQNLGKRIYAEWFPGTGYERGGELELEVYPPCTDNGDPDYRFQMWVPVKKK